MIQTPSLAEYLVPTSVDFPTTQVIILESGTGVGPFGAKGIGEPALTPAAASGRQRGGGRHRRAHPRVAADAGTGTGGAGACQRTGSQKIAFALALGKLAVLRLIC